MVLTIDKLNLQVSELEKQYNDMMNNLGNNIVNYVMQYQTQMNQVKANIDLIHKQIKGLVHEEQKAKKEIESKNKKTR